MAQTLPALKPGNGGLQFIISTDNVKPDGDARKLIRSHVMKGKNTRSRQDGHRNERPRPKPATAKPGPPHQVPSVGDSQLEEGDNQIAFTAPPRRASVPARVGTEMSGGFHFLGPMYRGICTKNVDTRVNVSQVVGEGSYKEDASYSMYLGKRD